MISKTKSRKGKRVKLNKNAKRKSKDNFHFLLESRLIVPVLLLIIITAMFILLKPSFIGYFALENTTAYRQDIDALFIEDSIYLLYLEHDGELRSLKLNGEIIGKGTARVYLETDNESYLIFDSSALEKGGLTGITGLAVGEFSETEENESTPLVQVNETILDESLNETQETNETDDLNETLSENNSIELNENLVNETLKNTTNPSENAEILVNLEYNDGTEFDADNNGIEARDGIVDFNVNVEFNWDVNEDKLCTKWETESLDNETSVAVCYGNDECCSFIGLESLTSNWNEVFYSYYSRYGATAKNKISAQVVYVDYSLIEENPYSYIYYSDWASLNAVFLEEEEEVIKFNDICAETCLLSLNKTFYKLRVKLENATLRLDNISYVIIPKEVEIVNNNPILLANISDILIGKGGSISIDLNEYFFDQDNEPLQYIVYEMEDVSVFVNGSVITLTPNEEFIGVRNSFFIANDSRAIAISNVFKVNVVEAEELLEIKTIVIKNITETPTQLAAEINKPVKWIKTVKAENNETIAKSVNVPFNIPEDAFNLAVKDAKLDKIIDKNKIVVKPNKEMGVLKELKEDKTKEKEFEFEDSFEINETKDYVIEYETEAPVAFENQVSEFKKQIVVSSDVHYTNVLVYTNLPTEAKAENIRLYWVINNTRELFRTVNYYDLNNNSLVDKIEWIVPGLSNQTFEVEITVLNVQSYPTVGGEWIVQFTTTGLNDLTITAVNGTTYGDSAPDDLSFIELRCGQDIVNVSYDGSSVFVADYECNETAYHTVRVLTEGVHTQEFRFGDAYAYANNLAGQIPKTLNIQGKLTDSSGSALTGNYNFSFKIYNVSSGGTKLWEENQTLVVQGGIYDAVLGSSVALTLDFDRQYYLGIQVGTDDEMAPRLNLTSSPYSYRASFAENITLYATGGLIMDSNGLSLNRSCGNNEILKWDGSSWNCAGDSGTGSEADTLATVTGRGNTTTQPLTIDSDGDEKTNIGGTLYVNGNNNGGNIGIGTDSPTQKLDVAGSINVSGNITSASSIEYNIGSATIDNISDVTINKIYTLDYMGWSVSYAGDVNGDGYSDVIVGAYMSNAGGPLSTWKGQAHILFGNSTMDNTPDVTMTGLDAGDRLGIVSYAGDVNGDGYSDVIAGADRAEGGGTQRGEAYIYFGGSSMNNAADVTMSGLADNDYLGYAVSYAGDVNGDGYDDVIVGANGAAIGGTLRGQAHVYFGGPDMDGTAEFTMNGSGDSNYFGYSVSYAGDVNGDGYSDVIVGAYGAGTGGESYIYLGGPDMDNVADVTMSGATVGDEFGYDVSYAGDINGDGYDDVIVGARSAGDGGEAYIYFGGPSMDNTIDVSMNSSGSGYNFGRQVSYAGDVNGDGYSDVIIGAYSAGLGESYIYFGGSNMDNVTDITLSGGSGSNYFGYSVSYAGDVNKDGYDDVIIGAKNADTNNGRAYVYYGSGNRWNSIFAQEINLKTGLHIGELILNRYGLETWTSFGIKSPNWEIDRVGTASFQDVIVGTNLTVDSGTLFVDGNNNKVGIGTTTPTQKLDVNGSINISGTGAKLIFPDGTTLESNSSMGGAESDTLATVTERGNTTTQPLTIDSDGNEQTNIGGTLYVNGSSNGASVGIGTIADPYYKLQVSGGDVRFVTGGEGSMDIRHSNLVTSLIADATVQLALGAGNSEAIRIKTDGNVGIGTTSPSAKLDINGSGAVFNIQNTTGSSKLFVNATSGNVGIGTASPSEKLEVNGNIYANKGFFDHTANILDDLGAINFGTPSYKLWNIKRTTTGNNLAIDYYSETLVDWYNALTILNANGNVGIGTTSPTQKLDVNGSVNITGIYYGDGSGLTGLTASSTSWNRSGTYVYLANTSDSVGIGTTDPGARLQINAIGNSSWSEWDDNPIEIWDGSETLYMGAYDSSNVSYIQAVGDAAYHTLLLQPRGGNVGIGTTTSEFVKLNILGTSYDYDTTKAALKLDMTADPLSSIANGFGVGIDFHASRGSDDGQPEKTGWISSYLISGAQTTADLWGMQFGVRDDDTLQTAVTILNTGNVGIGTTEPDTLLTLGNGTNQDFLKFNSERPWIFTAGGSGAETNLDLKSTGDDKNFRILDFENFSRFEFKVATSSPSYLTMVGGTDDTGQDVRLRLRDEQSNVDWSFTLDQSDSQKLKIDADDSVAVTVETGGNVGIGTTSPDTKLEVSGGDLSITDNDAKLYLGDVGAVYLADYDSGDSDKLELHGSAGVLLTGGNVGIGTDNPSTKLDVAGNIRNNGIFESTQSISDEEEDSWTNLGTWSEADGGETLVLKYYGGQGYNNDIDQNVNTEIQLRRSWDGDCDTICVQGYFYDWGGGGGEVIANVSIVQIGGDDASTYDIYVHAYSYSGYDFWQALHDADSDFVWNNTITSDPGTDPNVRNLQKTVTFQNGLLTINKDRVEVGDWRPITISGDEDGGMIYTQGDAEGGWAFGYHAKGSSGTDRGGFGFLGEVDDLTYYYIGPAYDSPYMVLKDGYIGINTTEPDSLLEVSGGDIHMSSNAAKLRVGDGENTYIADYSDEDTDQLELYGSQGVLLTGGTVETLDGGVIAQGAATISEGEGYHAFEGHYSNGTTANYLSSGTTATGYNLIGANDRHAGFGVYQGANIVSPVVWMYDAADNAFDIRKVEYDTDFTEGESLMVVRSSGKVGIGTPSPSSILHISASDPHVNIDDYSQDSIEYVDSAIMLRYDSTGIEMVGIKSGYELDNSQIGTFANRDLSIVTNGLDRIYINSSNGNVGIGTTSPGGKLHVVGAIVQDNADLPTSIPTDTDITDGIAITSDEKIYARLGVANLSALGVGYPTYLQTGNWSSSVYYNLLLNPNGGNVGIGTESPDEKLDIIGTASTVGRITTTGTDEVAAFWVASGNAVTSARYSFFVAESLETSPQRWDFGMRGDKNWQIFDATTYASRFSIDTSGNVGVLDGSFSIGDGDTAPYAGTDGVLYVDTSGGTADNTGTLYDLAEEFYTKTKLDYADVVIASDENVTVELTNKPYDTRVLGVISTTPNIIFTIGGFSSFGGDNITVTNTTAPITLAGRVPVKVTNENGIIKQGDLLTSSSTLGHAMKFTLLETNGQMTMQEMSDTINENEQRRNSILGKALEPCYENKCKILALVTLQ